MKEIWESWTTTDGYEYILISNGDVYRKEIGCLGACWEKVMWSYERQMYYLKT